MTRTVIPSPAKRIDQICDLGRGRVISQEDIRQHAGVYPVYSSQSSDEGIFGYIDTFDFEGDYVTWTTDGANAGTVFFRTGQFNCTNVCGTLKPKSSETNANYLARALSKLTKRYVSYVGNPKLMNNVMAAITVSLPPRQDQDFVADALDTADALIAAAEAVVAKLRQVRAGLLHDLLTRGLDPNGQLRDPAANPKQFKDSPLGRIPRAWEVRKISELIGGFETGVSVDSNDIPVAQGEIGVLKTGCVNGGLFDPNQNKRVKPDHIGRVRCNPEADSVIISRMNTPQLVGESAYVPHHYSHVFLPDRLWQSVKHPDDPTCMRWLAHSIQTAAFRDLISGGATGTSGSMKNISQGFFLALKLRTPPKTEQERIADLLATHDRLIAAEQAELTKLRQLKSGLMTDLLEGRVRVPEII